MGWEMGGGCALDVRPLTCIEVRSDDDGMISYLEKGRIPVR
jgi:hypothetical protein